MARKIYRTLHGITSLASGLVINKETKEKVYVYFTGGVTHPKFIPSTYETSDPKIQAALEKSASFGKKFELAAAFKDEAKKKVSAPVEEQDSPEDIVPKLKAYPNTSIQTAITTLIKQGWEGDADTLVDVDTVQAAAKSIGIVFDKLK